MENANRDTSKPPTRTALLAGCTGLVGSRLLRLLLEAPEYGRVHALTRRPLPFDHARLANRILPLQPPEVCLGSTRCDDAFCCVGSPPGSDLDDDGLRRVNVDLVLAIARAAHAAGARRFVVLSAAGADEAASSAFLRHKAAMERALSGVGFASLDVLRPGPLAGWRDAMRPADLAAALLLPLAPLVPERWAAWRAVRAGDVAEAMLGAARSQRRGVYVYSVAALPRLQEFARRRVARA